MSLNRHTLFSNTIARVGVLILAILLPLSASAQDSGPPKRELTDKVQEAVAGIVAMVGPDQKNYDGAINVINNLLAQVKTESFDTAYLSQLKAQAYLGKQDYVGCVPPLETAYRLSRAYKFFDQRQELEILWMLAQLYVQDALSEKNLDIQRNKFTKALSTVREWISITPKANFNAYYFASTILYQQATGTAGKEPDKELLKQCIASCLDALTLANQNREKEQSYQLLVAAYQAMSDMNTAAKYLELLIAMNPKNSQNWTILLATYINAADPLPEGSFLRNDAYGKAVFTILRAQKNGFMNTPQDNQRMLACYYNSGQYEGAIDVLENGLRTGKVDADYKNWELLANCYLNIGQTQKAIATFKEVSKLDKFKNDGNIDMQIGYLYFGNEQYRTALDYMILASKKGVVANKQASLLYFIGYLHLELKELDEAVAAVTKSLEIDPKSQQAKELLRVVKDEIETRNRALNQNKPVPAPQPGQPAGQQQNT